MEWLVWTGAAVSLLGLVGLLYCVRVAMKAKKEGLSGEEMHARLKGVVALNMGALFVSAIGLMMVVMGIML
jgi:hypothetical protein